ncbi:MAG: MBOAT family protein [Spirochaetales bacterium]|nr:MBOAT family protein [Spirochaetales bacterium]
MIFPTIEFGLFFFVVFVISWQLYLKGLGRKIFLIIASYFFYGFWNPLYMGLLLGCTLINYLSGLFIGWSQRKGFKKLFLAIAVILNLGILGYFKYYGFFISSLNGMFLSLGVDFQFPFLDILLPVGISFFTFQAMSYVIDVYRKDIPHETSFFNVMLYIAFFPQLVAGPIVRAKDFIPQLKIPPNTKHIEAGRAFLLIFAGLFKKVVVANYLATLFVDKIFVNPLGYSALEAVLGVYGYAIQIYCDFSAYSDIAIGVAILLGYTFPVNFRVPYRAESLKEFWKRWHISLSTWLRDYLYIPLGGNRKGKINTYRNLLVTMLLGGLWHGAAWNFLFWGALHGAGLCVEKLLGLDRKKEKRSFPVRAFRIFLTFNFVCVGWIFFRSESLDIAMEFFQAFTRLDYHLTLVTPFVVILIGVGIFMHFLPRILSRTVNDAFIRLPVLFQGVVMGVLFWLLGVLASDGVAPFIYFQF